MDRVTGIILIFQWGSIELMRPQNRSWGHYSRDDNGWSHSSVWKRFWLWTSPWDIRGFSASPRTLGGGTVSPLTVGGCYDSPWTLDEVEVVLSFGIPLSGLGRRGIPPRGLGLRIIPNDKTPELTPKSPRGAGSRIVIRNQEVTWCWHLIYSFHVV